MFLRSSINFSFILSAKVSANLVDKNYGSFVDWHTMSVAIVLKEEKGASATTCFMYLESIPLPYFCKNRRAVTAPIDLPHNIIFLYPLFTRSSII